MADGGTLNINVDVTGEDDSAGVRNSGTIEAIDCGVVNIGAVVINDVGGTIEASGHDAVVDLFGATINGGTLETSCGGIIQAPSETSIFNGVTIADGSILETNDGTFIDLENATTINGTVTFEGGSTFVLDPEAGIDRRRLKRRHARYRRRRDACRLWQHRQCRHDVAHAEQLRHHRRDRLPHHQPGAEYADQLRPDGSDGWRRTDPAQHRQQF